MRSYVAKIGLFDKGGNEHSVELQPGVNVITGRSSTGKSALMEIFDYCFGSSEETIPDGIITDNADIYFVILSIKEAFLVLARDPYISTRVFFKYDLKFKTALSINRDYFEEDYFLSLKDFKSTLGNFLGIDVIDTDEDVEQRKQRKKGKGRPSVRNMTSYFMQHQNLIANKHSLFYRFDEKEKREQTIDQFKIFCGFVDQEYYLKKQELNELRLEFEREKRHSQSQNEYKNQLSIKLQDYLNDYTYTVGKSLFNQLASDILIAPKHYLDSIEYCEINPDFESDEYVIRLKELNEAKNIELGNKREKAIRLNQINSTIEYAKKYSETIDNIKPLEDARKNNSECPFCRNNHNRLERESNKLSNAINWLNSELQKTPLLLDSLQPEKRKIEREISEINEAIFKLNKGIEEIFKINDELKRNKSLEEQGFKIILQIENILEEAIDISKQNIEQTVKDLERKIEELEKEITEKYNYESKLKKAQKYITNQMNLLGARLDFEKTYQPIKLNFDIEAFELYHLKKDKKRVYLRSMGSGANWLYSHVCLFTSLLRYFCSLKNRCKIPSILFMDQPSQVYFPTVIDNDTTKFDPKTLKKIEKKEMSVDDDLKAVTNLFDQLVAFCYSTEKETGIRPQIIITDHADNLQLINADFEDLVNGRRWREENSGLVKTTLKEK
jgi:hypothetical protein